MNITFITGIGCMLLLLIADMIVFSQSDEQLSLNIITQPQLNL